MSTRAEQSKAAGNSAFRSLNYPLALAHYSTAIQLDPSVSTYPLNRAAVYLKTRQYAEAEKDATRALELEGGVGAKALFRRGLARKGLGKLKQAKQDFEEAKKQGAGADVDAELASLVKELEVKGGELERKSAGQAVDAKEKENVKPEKVTAAPPQPKPEPKPSTTKPASTVSPSADRLRAALSSPSEPSASISPSSALAEPPSDGLLQAVSTRRLTPSSSPASPAARSSLTDSSTSAADSTLPKAINSFATKKSAREARTTQPFRSTPAPSSAVPPLASVPPSPPGAKPSPAPPIPLVSPSEPLTPSSQPSPAPQPFPSPARKPDLPKPSSIPSPTALEALHLSLPAPGHPSRLSALRSLPTNPPAALRAWAGEGGLTPDLLSGILADLNTVSASPADEGGQEWIYDLVRALPGCRRWDSAVLFLEEGEKEVVRRVVEGKERELRAVERGWGL